MVARSRAVGVAAVAQLGLLLWLFANGAAEPALARVFFGTALAVVVLVIVWAFAPGLLPRSASVEWVLVAFVLLALATVGAGVRGLIENWVSAYHFSLVLVGVAGLATCGSVIDRFDSID